MIELRCLGNVLFGVVSKDARGTIEVKCRGKWCGHQAGVVVLHTFNLETGKVEGTEKYNDPNSVFNPSRKKEETKQ